MYKRMIATLLLLSFLGPLTAAADGGGVPDESEHTIDLSVVGQGTYYVDEDGYLWKEVNRFSGLQREDIPLEDSGEAFPIPRDQPLIS